MAKNKNMQHGDSMQEVEETLTRTEQFLENHLNLVLYVIGGIIVVVLGILGVSKYYMGPRNAEAQEEMYAAQNYFSKDSFNLALNGDGVSLGFLDIIDNYGSTDAGNLAEYYTGISYLHLGDYEAAIDHLKNFSTDDMLVAPIAESAKGDAYVELGEYDKAISAYNKALKISDNEFTSPAVMNKLALVYEKQGNTDNALELYKEIKEKYPQSSIAADVEKSIARVNQL
jgi:tetratricopeptide (TPR) repeat protein